MNTPGLAQAQERVLEPGGDAAAMAAPALRVVGQSAPRKDALEKVTGRALYTTDIVMPGMLHAKVLRSARAHARILSIDVDAARQVAGVHRVVTGADIPQHIMPFYGYFIKDQPIVALDKVRYIYTDVSHQPLYHGQCLFDDVDAFLTGRGFRRCTAVDRNRWQQDSQHRAN